MWDFSILLSIKLIVRTLPFLALRLIVSLLWYAILAATVFATIIIFVALGNLNKVGEGAINPQIWLLLVAGTALVASVVFLVLRWLRKWALYRVKAAHIAVLVEFIQGRDLPPGTSQIRYGEAVVRAHLGDAAAFFLLDEAIKLALRGIQKMFKHIETALPGKSGASILLPIQLFLYFALSFMDEIVLGHIMNARSEGSRESWRRALTIYGESQLTILKNAFWLTVFAAGIGALAYYGAISPAYEAYQAAQNPETLRDLIIATAATLAVMTAFLGPFSLVCMLQAWFRGVLDHGWSPVGQPRTGPLSPQFERLRSQDAAIGRPQDGPRNGEIV